MVRNASILAPILFLCLCSQAITAQSVGINTNTPDGSAMLDIQSTAKGILVPRMNSGQREGIISPAIGLLVFDIDTESFWYYHTIGWLELVSGAFKNDGGTVKSSGNHGTDDFVFGAESLPPPTSISDTMFLFDKSKGAFRTGRVFNTKDWAPDSIGYCSFAAGSNVLAKGIYSFASGRDSEASGNYAVAMGYNVSAQGVASTAFGLGTSAAGAYSMASGISTNATGLYSSAFGTGTTASSTSAIAMGNGTTASGIGSLATGIGTFALGSYTTALGNNSTAESYASVALGRYNIGGGSKTSWQSADPLFEIGIGTSAANTNNALTVLKNGTISFMNYSFPIDDGSANQHLSTNGAGQLQWQNDIGAFVRTGQLVKNSGNHYTDDFVFGSGSLPPAGAISDTLMFFDKSKSAFRAGALENKHNWAPDSIGDYSFAVGLNPRASGLFSIAIGNTATATNTSSVAIGSYAEAKGNQAVAIGSSGNFTRAKGDYSLAMKGGHANGQSAISIGTATSANAQASVCIGLSSTVSGVAGFALGGDLYVESFHSTAIGAWNVGGGNPTSWIETDPLFEVANGPGFNNPSNALTILKNGDTRIQHGNNGGASGLKLENSSNGDWIRLYVSSGSSDLRLYSKSQGVTIIGAFDDITGEYTYVSDRRVKENFEDLHFDWESMMRLKPLTYQFIGDKRNTVSIGMIAQDVKEVYPEMIRYQEDEDLYHMNYTGFGVIAIKAIQELRKELDQKNEQMDAIVQKNLELESRIDRLEALLNK